LEDSFQVKNKVFPFLLVRLEFFHQIGLNAFKTHDKFVVVFVSNSTLSRFYSSKVEKKTALRQSFER
jgi:hypothetical protein